MMDAPMRTVPLDGALLTFDRNTGRSIVREDAMTAHLVQRAPRVVQFGITNACNLACSFCSRDELAKSEWTPASAFDLLAALSEAGTLEVAFGGGEPFAFRGFTELVRRLHQETALAISVTTNGMLLTPAILEAVHGHVAQIRMSIYDEEAWRPKIALLAKSGVRFGANVLVTPARLPKLEALVLELHSLGCRDVLVLAYKGPEEAMHLSAGQHVSLARSIGLLARALQGMRISLDICFGDRLALPRAMIGVDRQDCGAGRDFLVVTSDKRIMPCSFHREAIPFVDAPELLRHFDQARAQLSKPVLDASCARNTAPSKHLPIWKDAP